MNDINSALKFMFYYFGIIILIFLLAAQYYSISEDNTPTDEYYCKKKDFLIDMIPFMWWVRKAILSIKDTMKWYKELE